MNTAILHSAKPSKAKAKSKLPKQAIQFAKQMGLDLNGLTAEAEDIWAMLDDLASNKPDEYTEFVQEQFENSKTNEVDKEGGKYFRPEVGFCIRLITTGGDGIKVRDSTINEKSGKKLFINMCSHPAIEPPTDQSGTPVLDDRPSGDGLQFPLLIGPLRDTEDADGAPAIAVDAIFHPSVVLKCKLHISFKRQVIDLTMQWVQQETGVLFDKLWTPLKSPEYMGGRGHNRDTPVLFSVDYALKQTEKRVGNPGGKGVPGQAIATPESLLQKLKDDGGTVKEDSTPSVTELLNRNRAAPTSKPTASVSSASSSDVLFRPPQSGTAPSPAELTAVLTSFDKVSPSTSRTAIIEELGPDGCPLDVSGSHLDDGGGESVVQLQQRPSFSSAASTTSRASKPLISKGFLEKAGGKLYPEGSTEGAGGSKGGTYSRFMDKCQIVDTSKMTPDEVNSAMKRHAGPVPAAAPPTSASPPSPPKHKLPKLDPKEKLLSPPAKAELDSLMSLVDEEYALQVTKKESDGWDSTLQDIVKVLGGGGLDLNGELSRVRGSMPGAAAHPPPRPPSTGAPSPVESVSSLLGDHKSIDASTPAPTVLLPNSVRDSRMLSSAVADLTYDITSSLWPDVTVSVSETTTDDRVRGLVMTVSGLDKTQLRATDLQVSDKEVRLIIPKPSTVTPSVAFMSVEATGTVSMKTRARINKDLTKAAMSKKKMQLLITVALSII